MTFTDAKDSNGRDIRIGDKLVSEIIFLRKQNDISEKPCQVIWNKRKSRIDLSIGRSSISLKEALSGWKSSVFTIVE